MVKTKLGKIVEPEYIEESDEIIPELFEGVSDEFATEIVIRELVTYKEGNAVALLKYLKEHKYAYTKEIARGTGIAYAGVTRLVRKLQALKVIETLVSKAQSYHKYHRLNPNFPVEETIKRFHMHVGMILYKHVPLNRPITEEELKAIPKFRSDCRYYKLTLDEGIEAVRDNKYKIEMVAVGQRPLGIHDAGSVVHKLRRKEQ